MANENYDLGYPLDAAPSTALSERAAFIRRVYAHLAGAVLALVGAEALLINLVPRESLLRLFGEASWLLLVTFLLFLGGGFVARMFARSQSSPALQYVGLGLYVGVWTLFMWPILAVVIGFSEQLFGDPNTGLQTVASAAILSLCVFAGLTISVFVTRKDYSALAPILSVGSLILLGVIICSMIFGFSLGILFCAFVIALISGYILYDTSNVIHHYPTTAHVAAALELFADAAMLFWYILRIMLIVAGRGRN